jgi:hypothetical protein
MIVEETWRWYGSLTANKPHNYRVPCSNYQLFTCHDMRHGIIG